MFLLSANRTATRQARIRQWLILLTRVLAIAALIFVVSRPLAGGWLGWVFQGAPDAIVVLLDRSLSMETKINGATKREIAIQLISGSLKSYQGKSQIILIDSASRIPQEIGDPSLLERISFASATDTSADIIAGIESAIDWIQRNKPGSVEIWIASDLQKTNWQPENERWRGLIPRLTSVVSNLRVRLLHISNPSPVEDNSVLVKEASLKRSFQGNYLALEIAVERTSAEQVSLPVNLFLNGSRQYFEIPCQGQSTLYRHSILIDDPKYISGWGKIEIPADANSRNNIAYFVYSPPPILKAGIVSSNSIGGKILAVATAPLKSETNRVAELIAPEKAGTVNFNDYALIIWNDRLPSETVWEKLRSYISDVGGAVLVFASSDEPNGIEGINFGKLQQSEEEKPWKIGKWREDDGLLARTEEGFSLPLNELLVYKRQPLNNFNGDALARFEDGSVFIGKKTLGKGQLIVCATSVEPDWSNLRDGIVLVPLIQRLFDAGAKRITQSGMLVCGEENLLRNAGYSFVPVEGGRDFKANAGIYKIDGRFVALNHPVAEDDFEITNEATIRSLFGSLPFTLFQEKSSDGSKFQSEVWRTFLICMILFLIIESILILPPRVETKESSMADEESAVVMESAKR